MPVSPAYRPDPRYPELGGEFADPVAAEAFPKTILRFRNDRAAASVGLDTLTDAEWIANLLRQWRSLRTKQSNLPPTNRRRCIWRPTIR